MDDRPGDSADTDDTADSADRAAAGTHVPVLLDRVLALLSPALADRPAVAVDATLGLGGHAEALLRAHPQLTLVGLDRDPAALARSRERLTPYAGRIHLVHAVYDRMPEVLDELGFVGVDGVLFDLGVSSMQLDLPERGFAYSREAPLDMRMDQSRGLTAAEVVNHYSVAELARVLREYGEERFALRIAQAIDRARRVAPLRSTAELAELVREAIPAATRRHGGHPAKRTFQALRIEVNGELAAVRAAVPAALDALTVGGRIAVLAYHSLEDRIVKQAFAARATDTTPAELPVSLPDRGPQLRLLTRGGEPAGDAEIAANPRAASVRLRAAERIRVPA
jgi:16S rRNA (cytosine1402-N4)-methyltransferase